MIITQAFLPFLAYTQYMVFPLFCDTSWWYAGHPTYTVYTNGQVAEIAGMDRSFDAVGVDPYPIGSGNGSNASLVGQFAKYAGKS